MLEPDFSTNLGPSNTIDAADNATAPGTVSSVGLKSAIEFLLNWWPTGPWCLTAIKPDVKGVIETKTFQPNLAAQAERWIEKHQRDGRNIYYSVNRPTPKAYHKKAKKPEITEVVGLHIDIDLPAGRDAELEAQILERLRNHLWAPTCVVFSGGGFQALWRLQEPLNAQENRDGDRVELLNKQLIKDLGGDPACFNIDRILRLPGCINHPDEKKRKKGSCPGIGAGC